jgi:hypothetical protein
MLGSPATALWAIATVGVNSAPLNASSSATRLMLLIIAITSCLGSG